MLACTSLDFSLAVRINIGGCEDWFLYRVAQNVSHLPNCH